MSAGAVAKTPRKPAESANGRNAASSELAALMREIGSTQGFDPIPPDQYLSYQAPIYSPALRLWAWVLSKTIRQGHRSRYCVDERGAPLELKDAAVELGMDQANVCHAWRRLEQENRVAREGRLLVLRGEVSLDPEMANKRRSVVCTNNASPFIRQYIVDQLRQLPREKQEWVMEQYAREEELERKMLREAVAAVRSIFDQRKDNLLRSVGVKLRREKSARDGGAKRRNEESVLVPVLLPQLPLFVQTNGLSVQTNGDGSYKPENLVCTDNASLYDLENYIENSQRESSSSSAVSVVPATEPTTTTESTCQEDAGRAAPGAWTEPERTSLPVMSEREFSDGLAALFEGAKKPAPTAAQCSATCAALPPEARQAYLDDLRDRVRRFQHPGALAKDVVQFATDVWPRRQHAEAEKLRRQLAWEQERKLLLEAAAERFRALPENEKRLRRRAASRELRRRHPLASIETEDLDRLIVAEMAKEGAGG